MIPAEFELTLDEKKEIEEGLAKKRFAKAEDAVLVDYDGKIQVSFPAYINRTGKRLRGTYEQIVQYLIDMYPPLEPDCPRIRKGIMSGFWHEAVVELYVDKWPTYPGKDINRIAALLKKYKRVFVEDKDAAAAVRAMFPIIHSCGQMLFYEGPSKPKKGDTRKANRIKKGLVMFWEVRRLYDGYLYALNRHLYSKEIANISGYLWPSTVEAWAERAMKLAAFCDRSRVRVRPYSHHSLMKLKQYIPGLLKRPEPLWRKFGRWLKKRTAKKRTAKK